MRRLRAIVMCSDHVPESLVRTLRRRSGAEVFEHYGMTEMGLGGGVDCEAHMGYHLRETDLYFEIVDPQNGELLPEGEKLAPTRWRKLCRLPRASDECVAQDPAAHMWQLPAGHSCRRESAHPLRCPRCCCRQAAQHRSGLRLSQHHRVLRNTNTPEAAELHPANGTGDCRNCGHAEFVAHAGTGSGLRCTSHTSTTTARHRSCRQFLKRCFPASRSGGQHALRERVIRRAC